MLTNGSVLDGTAFVPQNGRIAFVYSMLVSSENGLSLLFATSLYLAVRRESLISRVVILHVSRFSTCSCGHLYLFSLNINSSQSP